MTHLSASAAGELAESRARGTRKQRGARVFVRDILVIFAVAVLVSFLVKNFVVRSFYIPSPSMVNTLQVDDFIIVNELEPRLVPIQHGDVVVFKDPGGWLPHPVQPQQNPVGGAVSSALTVIGLSASDSDDHLVKRVIGLPGDRVACCNALGQLTVNGVPLKEPYIQLPAGEQNAASVYFAVTVPRGMLWVMGDNRWLSQDSSRNQELPGKGFVPESDVVGRAFVVSWPAEHWAPLGNYPDVFRGVTDKSPGQVTRSR
ncbi:MAG: signal peptidase [Microbacteriaceae bacterium]|jgi:signal peptidase I|nr:signal peptidase [Microbacteriaceae bacterium]